MAGPGKDWELVEPPSNSGAPGKDWELVEPPAPTPEPAPATEYLSQPVSQPDQMLGMTGVTPGAIEAGMQFSKGSRMPIEAAMKVTGSWAGSLYDFTEKLTPKLIKDWASEELQDHAWILDTGVGKKFIRAVKSGREYLDKFIQENPRFSEFVGNTLLTVSAIPAYKTGEVPLRYMDKSVKGKKPMTFVPEDTYGDTAKKYENQANKDAMIEDEQLLPSGNPFFDRTVYVPDPYHVEVLKTVPGLKGWQSNIQRHQIIKNNIIDSAQEVDNNLIRLSKTRNGQVSNKRLREAIDKDMPEGMYERYDLDARYDPKAGDALSVGEMNNMRRNLLHRLYGAGDQSGPVPVIKLHKVRQAIDAKYNEIKGKRFTEGGGPASREEMRYRAQRDILNKLVDEVAPETKDARKRLTALYELKAINKQKAVKDKKSYWLDVKENIPFTDKPLRISPHR